MVNAGEWGWSDCSEWNWTNWEPDQQPGHECAHQNTDLGYNNQDDDVDNFYD